MFIGSLVLCGIFIALLARWAGKKGHRVGAAVSVILLGFLGSACTSVPVFFWIGVAIALACLFGARENWGYRGYFAFSFVALLLIFGGIAANGAAEFMELCRRYPVESMASQLGTEPGHTNRSSVGDSGQIESYEKVFESDGKSRVRGHIRGQLLKQLHEATVLSFINSSGFGVERRVFFPGWLYLPEADPIPFKAPLHSAASDTGLQLSSRLTVEPDAKNLEKMHHEGVLDFVNLPGFGYIIDREHVRGFQPHHFHSVPEVTNPWQVQRIELVSLLMHESPVVYVSQNLPRMQELAGAPYRPLTAFEEQALANLRKGSDLVLVTAHSGEAIRVLGGIRALKQCCACHNVESGELLGAFSYHLERVDNAGAYK